MKEMSRLLISLTLIAACSGLILSMVENVTREPIKVQRRLQMLKAIGSVLPPFDNSPDKDSVSIQNGVDKKGKPKMVIFYRGRKDQKLVGTAFKVVSTQGYGGNIEIMVGIKPDDKLQGIEILSNSETPGLGARIVEPAFKNQFKGKSLKNADWRVKKDGGQFDQITGATISPRAVVKAVKKGLEFYRDHKAEIVGGEKQ